MASERRLSVGIFAFKRTPSSARLHRRSRSLVCRRRRRRLDDTRETRFRLLAIFFCFACAGWRRPVLSRRARARSKSDNCETRFFDDRRRRRHRRRHRRRGRRR